MRYDEFVVCVELNRIHAFLVVAIEYWRAKNLGVISLSAQISYDAARLWLIDLGRHVDQKYRIRIRKEGRFYN